MADKNGDKDFMKRMILKKELPGMKAGTEVGIYSETHDGLTEPQIAVMAPRLVAYIPNSELDEWVTEIGPWEPKEGEDFAYITDTGKIFTQGYFSTGLDHLRRDFLGVYRTESEAIKVRDQVREFVKSLNE